MAKIMRKSSNLFDENSEKTEGYIDDNGDILIAEYSIWTYDYFPITGNMEYTYISYDIQSPNARTIRVAWYDANKNFISRTFDTNSADVARTVISPSTAAYARLSIDENVYAVMFNLGSTALPYEPYYAPIWEDCVPRVRRYGTDTFTTLPITIIANGANMQQYRIYGNTGGVGDKTINYFDYTQLVDGYTYNSTGQMILNPDEANRWKFAAIPFIQVTPGVTYLITWNSTPIDYNNIIYYYDSEKNYKMKTVQFRTGSPFTVPNNCNFITYIVDISSKDRKKYMLTEGSTAPASFVPFGYKVDISTSDGTSTTTTPIYIGNNPLEKVENYSDYVDYELQKVVRAIKKYVLTGNENWEEITGAYASRKYFRWVFAPINYCIRHVCVSSHFTQVTITTSTTTVGFDVFDSSTVGGEVLAIRPTNVQSTTLADFKSYLAAQYAAGTPVTIWCALKTAEEVDPPEPLPGIPTFDGNTVIDYNGTPNPSSVVVTYKGWHKHSEPIRHNDEWTTPNAQQLNALQSPLSFTPDEDIEETEEEGDESELEH
jgi:hypothetical protein